MFNRYTYSFSHEDKKKKRNKKTKKKSIKFQNKINDVKEASFPCKVNSLINGETVSGALS